MRGLALGYLALIVRENIVNAAAVDVKRLTKILGGHCRALDVPPGIADAPRRIPLQDMGFRRLDPQGEVLRVTLFVAHRNAFAGLIFLHPATT